MLIIFLLILKPTILPSQLQRSLYQIEMGVNQIKFKRMSKSY